MTPKPWSRSGIPAAQARRHLCNLRRRGVPQAVLAAASGFSERRMAAIMSGETKFLKPGTHDAIMAVGLSSMLQAQRGKVSSEPSKRLVAEILAAGYSKGWICRELGLQRNLLAFDATITAARAQKIRQLHDRLWLANETGWKWRSRCTVTVGVPFRSVCECYGERPERVRNRLAKQRERARKTA